MGNIDSKKIEELTREFLIALGDDPDREGLKKTPNRVARMCQELLEGMKYSNEDIRDRVLGDYENLLSAINNNPEDFQNVFLLPQLHTLIWSNKPGV